MPRIGAFVALAGLAAVSLLSGCAAKAQAALPDPGPLTMPPAPARTVVPAAPEPLTAPAAGEATATPPAATPPSTPNRPARDTGGARTPPPVPPPAPPASTATPPVPAPTPLEGTANAGELEQRARALKDAAEKTLDRIDVRTLGADARAQYDTARRFLKQADDALRVKNVIYAWQLADKANTIATFLK